MQVYLLASQKYTVGTTLNLQGGVFYFGKGPDLCPNSGAPNYFGDLDLKLKLHSTVVLQWPALHCADKVLST